MQPTNLRNESSWLDVPLAEVPLSARAYRLLTDAGYRTLREVAAVPRAELARLPGFGPICLSEVRRLCREYRNAHARRLLASGCSLRAAGSAMGVSGEAVRQWLEER